MINEISAPKIVLWYGNHQKFGQNGLPQRWINILGRVITDVPLKSFQYSLNERPFQNLSFGNDQRRLVSRGDFNVDLDIRRLKMGENQVVLKVIDENELETTEQITVNFEHKSSTFPLIVDWDTVSDLQQAAQVVDGNWVIHAGGVSPYEIGYDRLIALGDMNWKDYEVVVPITIHGFNGACYEYPSIHAGVGVVMRWKGHSNWGSDQYASNQPFFGPGPYGAIGWYCLFHEKGPMLNFFDTDFSLISQKMRFLELHQPYFFKVKVETKNDQASQYYMKVWKKELVEPDSWDLITEGSAGGLTNGACMLVAHHVSASFGNIRVNKIS